MGKGKKDSMAIVLSLNERLFPIKTATREEKVIKPRPPIWMQIRINICPKKLKVLPISVTVSPVTHVAEVAVNKVSIKLKGLFFEMGRDKIMVPKIITKRKLETRIF